MAGRLRRTRRALTYVGATVAGGLIGLATLYGALGQVLATGTVQAGPWRSDPAIGTAAASPYLRAAISFAAVLALDSREVAYFFAFTDSDGRALDGACTYVLAGPAPAARWWSITAYRPDGYLPDAANGRYSVDSASPAVRPDGTLRATIVPAGIGDGDIALHRAGPFNLMLRLYQPPPGGFPRRALLPAILRQGCP